MGVLPLEGSRWILTRPRERAMSWRVALEENGAEVVLSPAILLSRGPSEPVLQLLDGIPGGSLFIFTSATTVSHFLTMINPTEHGALRSMQWIAVGPATAEAIREEGFEVRIEGDGSGADSLCSQLLSEIKCGTAIHFTSDLGLPIVAERLTAAGLDVIRAEVSRSQVEDDLDPNSWSDGQKSLSGIIFSSPASVRAVVSRIDDGCDVMQVTPAVATGSTTAQELQEQGWNRIEIAVRSTASDLIQACSRIVADPAS